MIINIRGVSGSGKTTIVRQLIERAERTQEIYGRSLGLRMPEANALRLPGIEAETFVIGAYDSNGCDGCDRIQPFELIPPLIEKYAQRGDVIFEGMLISTCWGVVGEALERRGRDAVVLFLDTPLETCIERVRARRRKRGDGREFDPANLAAHHARIASLRTKIEAGSVRALTVSSENAVETIIEILRRQPMADEVNGGRHYVDKFGDCATSRLNRALRSGAAR